MPIYMLMTYWRSCILEYYTQSLHSSDDTLVTAPMDSFISLELYRLIWCSPSFRISWIPRIYSLGYIISTRPKRRSILSSERLLWLLHSARWNLIPYVREGNPIYSTKRIPILSAKQMLIIVRGGYWRILAFHTPRSECLFLTIARWTAIFSHTPLRWTIWSIFILREGSSYILSHEVNTYYYVPRGGRLFILSVRRIPISMLCEADTYLLWPETGGYSLWFARRIHAPYAPSKRTFCLFCKADT